MKEHILYEKTLKEGKEKGVDLNVIAFRDKSGIAKYR